MSVHRIGGVTMIRAEWFGSESDALTDEQCTAIERRMAYAASCLVREWNEEAKRKAAPDRMTRDGEHYIGDGPYGA